MKNRHFLNLSVCLAVIVAQAQIAQSQEVPVTPALQQETPKEAIVKNYRILFDEWIRDTYVTYVEEDGYYYLTGTSKPDDLPNAFQYNDGIYLWRSKDMYEREALGLVWSFEKDATWQNVFKYKSPEDEKNGKGVRTAYAPEFHYINGDYYIATCMNWQSYKEDDMGKCVFLLKSASGKPEGPYIDAANGPLALKIHASLFQDDDGTVYFVWQDGLIAKMKDDMSGFAEEPRKVVQSYYPERNYTEGAFIFKRDGKYHMIQAIAKKDLEDGRRGYYRGGDRYSYDLWSLRQIMSMAPTASNTRPQNTRDTTTSFRAKTATGGGPCSAIREKEETHRWIGNQSSIPCNGRKTVRSFRKMTDASLTPYTLLGGRSRRARV